MANYRTRPKLSGIFILLFLFVFGGCGVTERSVTENELLGSWELLGMTKKRFEIEEVSKSDIFGGSLNFNADGTFAGDVTYPQYPEKDLKISGTYTLENGILTIRNKTNNSTSQSRVEFKGDYMIAVPVNPDALIAYYKRRR